jgi:hypothetical protein
MRYKTEAAGRAYEERVFLSRDVVKASRKRGVVPAGSWAYPEQLGQNNTLP